MTASGAIWLDRQLLAKDPPLSGGGFGAEVRDAMEARVDHLVEEGLARRQGQRVVFARDLIATLRRKELDDAAPKLSEETELTYQPAAEGERVSGVYRQRVMLASGRFAMIDDGLGFQLVPWRPRWRSSRVERYGVSSARSAMSSGASARGAGLDSDQPPGATDMCGQLAPLCRPHDPACGIAWIESDLYCRRDADAFQALAIYKDIFDR